VPDSIVMPVRSCLRGDSPQCVAKAARCLAAMQETGSVGDLIALLGHDDSEVLRETHAALISITNVKLLPDKERWNRWLATEAAWFRDEFPELSGKLRGSSAVIVVQTISQMAAHPLYRREISEALTNDLEHEPASIRKMACSALRQLGAKSAVPMLERWAEDTDPDLAVEARRALSAFGHPGVGSTASATTQDEAQGTEGSSR
jgi:HEAT repeat protein